MLMNKSVMAPLPTTAFPCKWHYHLAAIHFPTPCSVGATLVRYALMDRCGYGDTMITDHSDDGTPTNRHIPMELGLPSGCGAFSNIALGFVHSGAICSDGPLCMWGCIFDGRLCDGTIADCQVPVQVALSSGCSVFSNIALVGACVMPYAPMDHCGE